MTARLSKDRIEDAWIGLSKVMARADATTQDDLTEAYLVLLEIMICLSAAQSRTQWAEEVAQLENALSDTEPRSRGRIIRERLELPKSSYYRHRKKAERLRLLKK